MGTSQKQVKQERILAGCVLLVLYHTGDLCPGVYVLGFSVGGSLSGGLCLGGVSVMKTPWTETPLWTDRHL